ncbi:MAG: lipid-A-disaccharide synthase [Verrucomicrobiae bacterium]|nr:lipid-A-disaccharide synthase [Verrucomicrobiae bacterium]
MSRTIFILAGEASGDRRGAELVAALRARDPSLDFAGMGGPLLRAAGVRIVADPTGRAVVGIVEALRNYGYFRRLMREVLDAMAAARPSVVVGVDYPGFNLRFLRTARARQGREVRLVQYVSPQLWAWNARRKWGMARFLDAVLCLFPFEPAIYEETGLRAVFVGHPLGGTRPAADAERERDLFAFFPGSREREVRAHLPALTGAAAEIVRRRPGARVAWAAASPAAETAIRRGAPGARFLPAEELLRRAWAGAVCSGTATLEAAAHGLPCGVVYRVAWPTWWMGRCLVRVPYLAMPNLLADGEVVREFLQSDLTAANVAGEMLRLAKDPAARAAVAGGYARVRAALGDGRAAARAAEEILNADDAQGSKLTPGD